MFPLRRIAGATALALSAVLPLAFTAPARAEAPQVKTQAPGFYRMMVGDFEVTVLNDGTTMLKVDELLTNTTKAKVDRALGRAFLSTPLETSVNGFLVNTGSKLVLIDAGAGTLFGPTVGKLVANLKATGYQPEQIDEIYITHMHADHVGGLMAGEALAFPNAVVRADKADADFWLSEAEMARAPDAFKGFFKGAMASVNPYVKAGKFKPFEGVTDLVPGVRAVPAHGHTKGHSTYVVESKGEKLVLWGDLMHVAAVQFPEPETTIKFDTDAKSAMAERKKAYAAAAKGRYWVAAAHLPFPGIGHIRAEGKGYVFQPANYTTQFK